MKIQTNDNCLNCDNYKKKYKGNDIAINTYYDIVKMEYDCCLKKKESINNRAGFLVTILAAMAAFINNKDGYMEILKNINQTLTLYKLLKVLIALSIFILYFLSVFYLIKTISVKEGKRFSMDSFNSDNLICENNEQLKLIIKAYKDNIKNFNSLNDKSAHSYQLSLIFTFITIFLIIIFNLI